MSSTIGATGSGMEKGLVPEKGIPFFLLEKKGAAVYHERDSDARTYL